MSGPSDPYPDPEPRDEPTEHPESLPPPDTRFPETYPDATGKGDIHIPGAGSIGMVLLLASLSMLFIASMLAFFLMRMKITGKAPYTWPPPSMPPMPATLWISTLVILSSSVTIQMAVNAIRRDDQRALRRNLLITFGIGLLFLVLQSINWVEFYQSIRVVPFEGPYLGGFFVLTGLHAAHVIGGLIPLALVMHRAKRGRYSRNFHPGVRYMAVYWHFLDVIWVALFAMIYF